jgi:hypothetical protein
MTSQWKPYEEPFRTTVLRNAIIAIVVGAALAQLRGGLARWPLATLLALWPSLGGHWVELWFLNWLRPPHFRCTRPAGCGSRWGVVRWRHRSRYWRGSDRDGASQLSPGPLARLVGRGPRLHRHRVGGTPNTAIAGATKLL